MTAQSLQAATLLGIGRPALSNFLNGKAALSQKMARRLERAFGADREYLLNLQAQYDRRDEAMRTSVVAGRHAPILIEIKAHRIEAWANTIRGREDLPPLLRHLVKRRSRRLPASISRLATMLNGADGMARSRRRRQLRGYRTVGPSGNLAAKNVPDEKRMKTTTSG